jgi:hypothetical protein
MKIKYILAVGIVALLAVPGTASQLAARSAASAPLLPAPVGASTAGLFHDPSAAPVLSIRLPSRFVAFDIGTQPLQSFPG